RREGLTAEQVNELVNRRSGLLGVSETSPDVRDLLARQADDPRAADAGALFCYPARKWVGALAAALGGLDTPLLAAPILEHAAAAGGPRRRSAPGSAAAWPSWAFGSTWPATLPAPPSSRLTPGAAWCASSKPTRN